MTRRLLAAGATIHELNCVRKHLSAIKGGRLAARVAGRVVTLALSDVVGDDPSVIGSGPTVADPSTYADALAILGRCGGEGAFHRGRGREAHGRSPRRGGRDAQARRRRSFTDVVSRHRLGTRRGARRRGGRRGGRLSHHPAAGAHRRRSERHRGLTWAATIRAAAAQYRGRVCLVSFGETTVTVRGAGRGGRNQEFALALVPHLGTLGRPVVVASIGTDGVDGPTDAAGARGRLGHRLAGGRAWSRPDAVS